MESALSGLAGVEKVEKDVRHDLFRVTSRAKMEDLVAAILKLGYTATAAPADSFSTNAPVVDTPPPEAIRAAIETARRDHKSRVLVKLVGDDCIACEKMARTFSEPRICRIVETMTVLELNVDHDETARWFAAPGVPESILFDLDGTILRRIAGFVAPDDFAGWLTK